MIFVHRVSKQKVCKVFPFQLTIQSWTVLPIDVKYKLSQDETDQSDDDCIENSINDIIQNKDIIATSGQKANQKQPEHQDFRWSTRCSYYWLG